METRSQQAHEHVLGFWFGEVDEQGRSDAAHSGRWFKKDTAFDDEIQRRFGALFAGVVAGDCDDWLAADRGTLAYVIVLDQFSRNLQRGSAESFANDSKAVETAIGGVARGVDRRLRHDERPFLYMPLMHSEVLAMQERCVAVFSAWAGELAGPLRDHALALGKFAAMHRDIVRRFGRFPHRNAILGRASTPEEIEFLKAPGSSF